MKVHESTAASCRYGDLVVKLYGDYDVVEDKSEDDYQGCVDLVARSGDDIIYVEFPYGSCSGCDDWEHRDLSDKQIIEEIKALTLRMTPDEYEAWKNRKHRTMRAW